MYCVTSTKLLLLAWSPGRRPAKWDVLVVNVLPVLHDAFNYSHGGHLKGQRQAES